MDSSKTLHELEGTVAEPPPFDSSLVRTCEALRAKPLRDLAIEDLRILIGQQIGLPWLLPLALDRLEADPLSEGDYYPGDLIKSVLTVDAAAWGLRRRLGPVLEEARKRLDEDPASAASWKEAIDAFRRSG